ncbi:MAG: hypothetical protein JSS21_00740 [Proteobacteria bacterium]|nr:hypothetical protein [Pseudomonadota bacterium]
MEDPDEGAPDAAVPAAREGGDIANASATIAVQAEQNAPTATIVQAWFRIFGIPLRPVMDAFIVCQR